MDDKAGKITILSKGDAIVLPKDVRGFLREYEELCKRYELMVIQMKHGTILMTNYNEKAFSTVENGITMSSTGFKPEQRPEVPFC